MCVCERERERDRERESERERESDFCDQCYEEKCIRKEVNECVCVCVCVCGGIFSRMVRKDLIEKVEFQHTHEGGGYMREECPKQKEKWTVEGPD